MKVSIKGVLIGGVADIVATNILTVPVIILVTMQADLHIGTSSGALLSALYDHPILYATQKLIGLGCSVLGVYLAAWIAKRDEPLNGALSSYLCVAIGVYSIISGKPSVSVMQFVNLIAAAACGGAGGQLRRVQKRSSLPEAPAT